MSDGRRFDADEASPIALELRDALSPYCERIEIAGSLRRMKELVGDIELVFVPRVDTRQKDFFCSEPQDLADEHIACMTAAGILQRRLNRTGHVSSWGPKNKHAVHVASGIPVDLFSTTTANWWVTLVIRTGSKETNLKLTTGAQRLGKTLNAYGCGITDAEGNVIQAVSEEHVFELCGVPYAEPHRR